MTRWTSAQYRAHQSKALDKKAARQRQAPKAKDKTALLFARLCEVSGLPAPIPEYRFHATRKWRIDYYFERNGKRVALEVEGGVWTGGRHTTGKGFMGDMEKYNAISTAGIVLLRTTPDRLMTIETINLIKATINA
jgi:anti-sigma factor RsiW